jgi:hypothetical protein
LASTNIVGVCDDNPETIGSDFCGREVLSPSQIRFLAPDAVVVADSKRTDEICRKLEFVTDRGISLIRLDGLPDRSRNAGGDSSLQLLNEVEDKPTQLPFSNHR